MEQTRFEKAIALIDKKNSEDTRLEHYQGQEYPKELLYSQRMTQNLLLFKPDASEELQLAARAQHICRWKIERNNYPMDRVGYIKWRETLKKMHAKITSEILKEVGYNQKFIDRVSFLINKRLIKKDEETQILEDVICLVFLQYYFEEFAVKHPDKKVIEIIKKTWMKMSVNGQEAVKGLVFSDRCQSLIKEALS
ncbi:DUF4202 domain-containing protein [Yeosuana sp. MJ-SS3]|uniref:DUF4202 domain-containing protein n=1 Tax=Gilvirhabdus luticola TaxID=3079858 RepID=A0ABU3U3S9_9FLAO|nr:DUF4202 domain-containing protein [Yeosuana sp. MJ-SS3]MDU8885067.1 DUF4202 domain-containing protein [Yeosuana sp. MJ-SS3]